jgi:outer membrane biosynthesis protein TonB
MSTMPAAPMPGLPLGRASRPGARPATASPRLRAVPAPAYRPSRAPFVGLVVSLLAGGLLAVLMLNTMLAQDAFVLYELNKRTATLAAQEQALRQDLTAQEAPQVLAERAKSIGMVKSESPVFLTPAGDVLGVPKPAKAPVVVVPKPVVKKPAAQKPAAQKPAAQKPAAQKPVVKKPATNKPATPEPGTTAARQPAGTPATGQAG